MRSHQVSDWHTRKVTEISIGHPPEPHASRCTCELMQRATNWGVLPMRALKTLPQVECKCGAGPRPKQGPGPCLYAFVRTPCAERLIQETMATVCAVRPAFGAQAAFVILLNETQPRSGAWSAGISR